MKKEENEQKNEFECEEAETRQKEKNKTQLLTQLDSQENDVCAHVHAIIRTNSSDNRVDCGHCKDKKLIYRLLTAVLNCANISLFQH